MEDGSKRGYRYSDLPSPRVDSIDSIVWADRARGVDNQRVENRIENDGDADSLPGEKKIESGAHPTVTKYS